MEPSDILKTYWGYDSFRPKQEEIVRAALDGKDVLAILPTGGGKSVCFQVPSLMKEGVALVVTPLIALMKDQVQNLKDRGIKALAIYTGMTRREVDLALNNAAYGDVKFLYISPERLFTNLFRAYLPQMNVSFIVVDEAHCISQWGYDFRPDYLEIGRIRKTVDAPVIALTATATPVVAEDIMDRLKFGEKLVIAGGFERENLTYIVRQCEDKNGQILRICNGVPGTGIVYVRSRKKTEEIAQFLNAKGISSSFYNAGLGFQTRSERQAAWKDGSVRVMVCTNAFGMGIDKPDVRFVIHADLPDSPEAYFQEAGRAGRDGKRSYAVLLWNGIDVRRIEQVGKVSFPSLDFIEGVYHKVHAYFDIPYDVGEGRTLKFNFAEFCKAYDLDFATTAHAMHYLELEGHWTYCEEMDIPTKAMIRVSRTALYGIDLPDPKMVSLLELMMRKCEGIFLWPEDIDEAYFSSALGVSVEQLRGLLYDLSTHHVISYIPSKHSDLLILRHDRWRPGNVRLSPQRYELLMNNYHSRAQTMLSYAQEMDECRSTFLLRYFGQTDSKPCGTCDICRARKAALSRDTKAMESALTEYIKGEKSGQYTLDEVVLKFSGDSSEENLLTLLRRLIDEGEVPSPK